MSERARPGQSTCPDFYCSPCGRYEPCEGCASMTIAAFERQVEPAKSDPDLDELGLLLYQSNAMAGEAGEVANVVKKAVRDRPERGVTNAKLLDECGDVLFYMRRLLLQRGLSIEDAANALLAKLAKQRAETQQ